MDVEFVKVPKYVSYKADLLCISWLYSQFNGKFSNDICVTIFGVTGCILQKIRAEQEEVMSIVQN